MNANKITFTSLCTTANANVFPMHYRSSYFAKYILRHLDLVSRSELVLGQYFVKVFPRLVYGEDAWQLFLALHHFNLCYSEISYFHIVYVMKRTKQFDCGIREPLMWFIHWIQAPLFILDGSSSLHKNESNCGWGIEQSACIGFLHQGAPHHRLEQYGLRGKLLAI